MYRSLVDPSFGRGRPVTTGQMICTMALGVKSPGFRDYTRAAHSSLTRAF